MQYTANAKRLGWLALGALIGYLATQIMPAQPVFAIATHGQDGYALATGPIDNNLEGVYFLDHLTGDLRGAAMNMNNGLFTTYFEANVLKDMQLDLAKAPKFLMVTGIAALRRGPTQIQPGQAVIYVMEVNSGKMAAYGVPWNGGRAIVSGNALQNSPFVLLNVTPFRNVAVRPQ